RRAALAGVRLGTQSNNVAGCRFSDRYGFVLGGDDSGPYQAMPRQTPEVALFRYLVIPTANRSLDRTRGRSRAWGTTTGAVAMNTVLDRAAIAMPMSPVRFDNTGGGTFGRCLDARRGWKKRWPQSEVDQAMTGRPGAY